MPENERDRCTKAHEYVFLLSKSKCYYFDQAAIAEEAIEPRGAGNVSPAESLPDERSGEMNPDYATLAQRRLDTAWVEDAARVVFLLDQSPAV